MKNTLKLTAIKGLTAISSIAAPIAALAVQTGPGEAPPPLQNLQFTQITGVLCTLAAWIFTILVVAAIIFVLIAAFNYLTAGGSEDKIKAANQRLIYAAVAVAVGIVARAFPFVVAQLFGATSIPTC